MEIRLASHTDVQGLSIFKAQRLQEAVADDTGGVESAKTTCSEGTGAWGVVHLLNFNGLCSHNLRLAQHGLESNNSVSFRFCG